MAQSEPAYSLSYPPSSVSTAVSSTSPTSTAPAEGNLLTRRQQNASYLTQLELPQLPPLSHLLPDNSTAATNAATSAAMAAAATVHTATTSTSIPTSLTTAPSSLATTATTDKNMMSTATSQAAAAAAAAAVSGFSVSQPPVYFGDYSLGPTTTTTNGMMHHPHAAQQAAQAAAVAAAAANNTSPPNMASTDLFVPPTTLPLMDQSMMPLDTTGMYTSLQAPSAGLSAVSSDPATAAAAMAAASATAAAEGYMKYGEEGRRMRLPSESSTSSADKIYSFVAIPGTNQKKRPRRRYDEIERLYHCNWPGCTKSYGTLNHLNAHVSMQKHVSFLSAKMMILLVTHIGICFE